MIDQKQIRDNAGMMRLVGSWDMVVISKPGPNEIAVSSIKSGWSFRGCMGLEIDGRKIDAGDLIIAMKDHPDLAIAIDWVVLSGK